ncbi:RDD family protein [Luteimonas composti]|uniref:RDD family protein n=1 Tax=Luteimonas composti TaxID=398257 RepID=A0ABT6MQX9_9GAMM|nr:RDD family protein [Luteimonas composti]MDH7452488.1 RDD family protein [Luteimonas composti]
MEQHNPYGSPEAAVADLAHGNLAGRGERLGAAIIDTIILLVVMVPLMLVGGYWQMAMAAGGEVPFGAALLWAAIGFAVFAAVQWYPLDAGGQTWGKRLLGIRIVDMTGAKPPVGRLLLVRYLPVHAVGNVPVVGMVLGLVNVLLIFRGDRRCGHDLVAGTQVVRNG